MSFFLLRHAWAVQNFIQQVAEISYFLARNNFKYDSIQKILYPAIKAEKEYYNAGKRIDRDAIMRQIAQGIVQYGKQQGIDLTKLEPPHIDPVYFGSLIIGYEKIDNLPAEVEEVKFPPSPGKRKIKQLLKEIDEHKKQEEEARRDVANARRKQVIDEMRKRFELLFDSDTQSKG